MRIIERRRRPDERMALVLRGIALVLDLLLRCAPALPLTAADPDSVTLQRYTVVVAGTKGRCTGVVLAQDIVLTAAHCLLAGNLRVYMTFRPPMLSEVTQAVPHPNYKA